MTPRRFVAALAIFAVAATGIGLSVLMFAPNRTPSPPAPIPRAEPSVPTPAEFRIGVVVTDQNCTGPNGCVYKYRVEPKYVGLHPLPDNEITVTYQVTGGHRPQIGDFTVQGDQARVLQDVPLEGPPGARLQAAVTKIVG
ncbi:hypothetical protein [Mycolicibacterium stellerae]|uniref:hypothetical protein n=1 Tax=Mycolicibacterium stellerae TaxID=2358193 RepID=UPI000F0B2F54|nr:hypothetical protein [Mycolicibacterium stellerae]